MKSESFLDVRFQELPSYVDYSKSLADDDFKFAFAFLEKHHKDVNLTPMKRTYI